MIIDQKLSILIIFACLSVGCSPVYNTEYSFTPPTTPDGHQCVRNCNRAKASCQQNIENRLNSCQRQIEQRCENRQDCDKLSYNCGVVDYEPCEEQYRSCYQSCGGTVKSQSVCVMGCD
jgi:hypothetical protein